MARDCVTTGTGLFALEMLVRCDILNALIEGRDDENRYEVEHLSA
jgi:hypothetical protein